MNSRIQFVLELRRGAFGDRYILAVLIAVFGVITVSRLHGVDPDPRLIMNWSRCCCRRPWSLEARNVARRGAHREPREEADPFLSMCVAMFPT